MIPYTVDRRADTGVTNVTMGIWLFLASEVMLFGALFSSYALLRTSAASWPHGREVLNLQLGIANTVVLLLVTSRAWRARKAPLAMVGRLMGLSTFAAVGFLVVKSLEYINEIRSGLVPSTNTFLALYYTLTGFHAAHVIAGVIANLWVMTSITRIAPAMTAGRIRAVSLYWLFVDVVWLVILVLLYLS